MFPFLFVKMPASRRQARTLKNTLLMCVFEYFPVSVSTLKNTNVFFEVFSSIRVVEAITANIAGPRATHVHLIGEQVHD